MGNKNSGNKYKATPGELLQLKQEVKVLMAKNSLLADRDLVKVVADLNPQYSRRNIKGVIDKIREERAKYIESIKAPKVVAESIGVLQLLEEFLIDMTSDDSLPAGVRAYCAMTTSMVRKQMLGILIDAGMLEQAPKPIVIDGLDLNEIFNGKERGDPNIMSSYKEKIKTIFIKAGIASKNDRVRSTNTNGVPSLGPGDSEPLGVSESTD